MAEKTYVLDTSIIIKWYVDEPDSIAALKIRELFDKNEVSLAVPDLVYYELANALRWNKNLNEKDVAMAVASFRSVGFRIFLPRPDVIEQAVFLAFKHNCTVYDAVFLALAKKLNVPLVTADNELAKAAGDSAVLLKDVV